MSDLIPPHDDDAERSVISAVFVDPQCIQIARALVAPEDFYSERHRRLFEAACELAESGQPVDVVQVATWLRDRGRISQVGGMAYITDVLDAAPAVTRVDAYAETVARKARLRRMILAAQRIASDGYTCADDDAYIDRAEKAVHDIAMSRTSAKAPDTMRDALTRAFTHMHENFSRGPDAFPGIRTGIDIFDNATGGLRGGESTIVAARPGIGKTSLAMNVATTIAEQGLGVIVFSMEMPNEQLATRALCSAAAVDGRKARTNTFNPTDWQKLTAAVAEAVKPEHFYLEEIPCGLREMRSYVQQRQSEMQRCGVKLGLVAVDYVQLMPGRSGVNSREEAVSENARGLKVMAKEMDCPVLLLSQLNRSVEGRQDKRPMLSDMRESGALEEAADCVIGLYRDDYYNQNSQTPGIAELILLKNRHGPTGMLEVGFRAESTTFYNLPPREDECQ